MMVSHLSNQAIIMPCKFIIRHQHPQRNSLYIFRYDHYTVMMPDIFDVCSVGTLAYAFAKSENHPSRNFRAMVWCWVSKFQVEFLLYYNALWVFIRLWMYSHIFNFYLKIPKNTTHPALGVCFRMGDSAPLRQWLGSWAEIRLQKALCAVMIFSFICIILISD